MFGLSGLDPKKMNAMMKQMGIHQEEIDSLRVIIDKKNGAKIIIENPSVTKIKMKGQESFQISGDVKEVQEISPEDIRTIVERARVSEEKARKALEQTGDLADAILMLNESSKLNE